MLPLFCVDAFTASPFSGNPAGVCLLDEPADARWMQQVAAEINLSETAFLVPSTRGYNLRWFTPLAEVDLCGHATLASAHVLWETGHVPKEDHIRFDTRGGILTARSESNWIVVDFPAEPAHPVDTPSGLSEALGIDIEGCLANRFDNLVVVSDAATVRRLTPDFERLKKIDVRGVIVTAISDTSEYHFISRFFAPAVGVPEDPVTGSAHCALGPYWAEQLGKPDLRGFQASSRGGLVKVSVRGNRVDLSGRAVTVWQGRLAVAARPV